eukprot:6065973-Amphidinium_carterae.1
MEQARSKHSGMFVVDDLVVGVVVVAYLSLCWLQSTFKASLPQWNRISFFVADTLFGEVLPAMTAVALQLRCACPCVQKYLGGAERVSAKSSPEPHLSVTSLDSHAVRIPPSLLQPLWLRRALQSAVRRAQYSTAMPMPTQVAEPTLAPLGPQGCGVGHALAYAAGMGYESMMAHFTGDYKYCFQNLSPYTARVFLFEAVDEKRAKAQQQSSVTGHLLTLPPQGKEVYVDMKTRKVRVRAGYLLSDQTLAIKVFWENREFPWEAGMTIRLQPKHMQEGKLYNDLQGLPEDDDVAEAHMLPKSTHPVKPGHRMGKVSKLARPAVASASPFYSGPNEERSILVFSDAKGVWEPGTITALYDNRDSATLMVRNPNGRTSKVVVDETPTIVPIELSKTEENIFVGQVLRVHTGAECLPCRVFSVPSEDDRYNPDAQFVVELLERDRRFLKLLRKEVGQRLRPLWVCGLCEDGLLAEHKDPL